jgi:hypothetical protein
MAAAVQRRAIEAEVHRFTHLLQFARFDVV